MEGRARYLTADAVTLSRVPIALAMVLVRQRPGTRAAMFVLGVVTDVIDGRLARRLGTSSPRGARLDSAADAVFVAASAVVVSSTVDRAARSRLANGIALVTVTRIAALLVTRRRFGSWTIMHTQLNKATGIGLAGVAAVALLRARMPLAASRAITLLAEIAALEELAVVLSASDYDPDRTSLLDRADRSGRG